MVKGEYFKQLPTWAKGLVALAIVGGVGYIGYKVYKAIKDREGKKDSKETVTDAKKELAALKNETLSKPESNYASAVNTIVKLLNGCETFGSEVQAIQEIIKVVKKKKDWLYLIDKFGVKDIDDCGWGKTTYDLPTLLKDQLDTSGVYTINVDGYKKSGYAINSVDILEEYLKTKGITL